MRKLPPLNAVRAFEAAARHVSFTLAAAELGVTHGAVSRQVAALEAWLRQPLFRRVRPHLQLTDAGRNYLAEVTAALDRLSLASLHTMQQATQTTLRVSLPPTFAMRWLIPRLSVFQRRRPDLQIQVLTSRAPVDFSQNRYDVAIRGLHERPQDCNAVPLTTELILPVCHADIVERSRLRSPTALVHQTLISYATEPYTWAEWLHAAGQPGLRPAGHLQFEELYFALQAASEGLGIVLVPLFLVIDDIAAGKLAAPFGSLGVWRRGYYACHPAVPGTSASINDFCSWLQEECRSTERSIAEWAASVAWSA